MRRRDFVFSLAALAAAPPWTLRAGSGGKDAKPLTAEEKEILGHIAERIVPEDEYPGARKLGAVEFIDRLLKEAHPDWIVVYRTGLKATDKNARRLYGKPFTGLAPDQQDELLRRMERGGFHIAEWDGIPSDEFFAMVRSHTMHGCYSHPKWGGNRDKTAWKMIGYDDWWA